MQSATRWIESFRQERMTDFFGNLNTYAHLMRYNPLRVVKAMEIKALGKRASTFCYNYPSTLQVETTTRCNLNCYMCPRLEELREKGLKPKDMPFEKFRNLLDNTHGIFSIHLFGRGEPLMCKEIFRMIEYSADRKIPYIMITTNGILLRGKTARALSNTRLTELRVSVDGSDAETYKKIRKADLGLLVSNLKEFRKISDIPMSLNYVLGKENFHSVMGMPALTAEVGAKCLRIRHMLLSGELQEQGHSRKEPMEKYEPIMKQLQEECERRGIALIIEDLYMKTCLLPFIMAFVDIDGYLTPCCKLEKIRVQNVHEAGLFRAWNSKQMRSWRRSLLSGPIPKVCKDIDCILP